MWWKRLPQHKHALKLDPIRFVGTKPGFDIFTFRCNCGYFIQIYRWRIKEMQAGKADKDLIHARTH